ncbi:hypothetical protein [Halosegnis longus]|uniref:hypothetical protein n=1 Tax=Halosegnis longus TaxID=2216012 RepID=UPI00117D68B3|nr:hypothetical protein [Salella cibi]
MSASAIPDDVDPDEYEVEDVDWLERNAGPVDIASAREDNLGAWERGKSSASEAAVDIREATGAAVVRLPDGDPHATLLVEAAGDDRGPWTGACDCEGWRYNNICAHVVTRACRSVIRSGEVPTNVDYYEQLLTDDQEDADGQDGPLSDIGGLEADGGESKPTVDNTEEDDSPDVVDVEPRGKDAQTTMPHTAGDPFASELATNVPERFVMDMGGEPYIRRAGYAAIARNANLRVTVDPVTAAEETEFEHARYKATVRDADGEVLGEDFGTAHLEGEDLAGAEYQLDELASTRAIRRALEWATGAGSTLQRGGGA